MIREVIRTIDIVLRLILLAVVAAFLISIGLIHNGMDSLFGDPWWRKSL